VVGVSALGHLQLAEDDRAGGAEPATAVASRRSRKAAWTGIPAAVGMSRVHSRSQTPSGTPCSGPQ
jgi:hypothetical protein